MPRPGTMPDLERLRVAIGEELAPYKLPEALHLMERIPCTPIGKVDLEHLRSEVLAATRPVFETGSSHADATRRPASAR